MSEERNPTGNSPGEESILEDAQEAWSDDQLQDEPSESGADEAERLDDGAESSDDEPSQEAPVEVRRQRVRSNARENFQRLEDSNRELRREIAEIRQTQQPRGPTPEQIAEFERREDEQLYQRIQMLDPIQQTAEVSRHYALRTERKVAAAIQQTQLTTWDATDRGNYERELAANPKLQRFDSRVEELRQQLARQNPNHGVSRMDILDKVIGEATRRNLTGATTRARNQAASSVAANGSRTPARSTGNVPSERTAGRQRRGWEHMRDVLI